MSTFAKTIAAGDFKTRCLALLDEVAITRLPLVVTKRGKPVARLVPVTDDPPADLVGSVRYASEEDLLAPVGERWDAEQ
ncbi:MAG: type II toxin-antitoxin system Phd/YefM family antitoxin [Thermoanaerobaculia bacterium]|nr:type II toxin-antitoxin system Phd/YefM family antitoxin [Thermoanaerobaculia bacterium]